MAYATLADVEALAPMRSFTASSMPTASAVGMFLIDTAAEIDLTLTAAGYQLPIPATATLAHAALRGINAIGAWARVEAAAPVSDDRDRAWKEWVRNIGRLDPGSKGPTLELDAPRQHDAHYAYSEDLADVVATQYFTPDMEL
jgi:hypothetical protein